MAYTKGISLSFLIEIFDIKSRQRVTLVAVCENSIFIVEPADPFEMPLTKAMLMTGVQNYFE
jgi:hypothetical protein